MLQTLKLLQTLKSLDIHPYVDGDKLRVRDTHKRLTAELRAEIQANRAALLERLADGGQRTIETMYALSPMQTGMFFHSQLAPNSGTYIEQTLWHVADPAFDVTRFLWAIETVINRHDSLRAALWTEEGNDAVQIIYNCVQLPINILDWRGVSDETYQARLAALIEEDHKTDFDLTLAPLLRLTMIERHREYDLLFTFHHIVMDRWSVNLFWSEVRRIYAGQPLPPATPYQTYIQYLRQQAIDKPFWQTHLRGVQAATSLLAATSQPQQTGSLATTMRTFSPKATEQLNEFARAQGCTLNTIFQATWSLLLARYTFASDVVFGMVTSGRTAPVPGIETIIGLFLNTLPFRVQLDATQTVADLLQQVAQTQIELQQREHTPLLDIQSLSEVPSGKHLFETVLLFQNTPQAGAQTPRDLALRAGEVKPGSTGYPLVASVVPGSVKMPAKLMLTYDTSRYDASEIGRLLIHWEQLAVNMAACAQQPVAQLSMLTQAEQSQIVDEWAALGGLPDDVVIQRQTDTRIYILDRVGFPVPMGAIGELHVDREQGTENALVEHHEFGRLFKTGILCRWSADKQIEQVGRVDEPGNGSSELESHRPFVMPRTAVEQQIAAIWMDVLRIKQVGVYDDFFLLGGHSLLATQAISRIRAQLLVNIPIASLFQYRTLETFAGFVAMLQANSQVMDAEFEEI